MTKVTLAVDLGSLVTNIYLVGSGLVLSEPTVAAVSKSENGAVKFIGNEAQKLIGKTSKNTKIIFPVYEGEIVNERVAEAVLGGFLKKLHINKLFGVTAIFSVPCGAETAMLDKIKSVASNVGISKVYFAESPILSALGQGIPLNDSTPCFVIDMAGGTTNIAAVTLDGIIAGISVNFGTNKITADIIEYLASTYGLQIGLLTAERLKREIGSLEEGDGLSAVVNGRDLNTGTPKAISLKANDILIPVKLYYDKVSEIAMTVLKKLPPEVSAEIRHSGIYISGAGAKIYSLAKYFGEKFDMLINIADNCMYSVALGGGVVVGNKDLLNKILIKY